MKRLKRVSISLLSTAFLLSGCGLLSEPVSMIKAPQTVQAYSFDQRAWEEIAIQHLPTGASLVTAQLPIDVKPVNEVDLDGDGYPELIVTYQLHGAPGETEVMVLKETNGSWEKIWEQKGIGYDFTYAGFADITGDGKEELLVGWTIGVSAGNMLDIFAWENDTFNKIASVNYHIMELFKVQEDQRVRIATWQKDTGDAFFVDVLKWENGEMKSDEASYPYYFPEVIDYYEKKVKEAPDTPFYWYYLADAELKAKRYEAAIQSAKKGMSLHPDYYPSTEQFQAIIEKAEKGLAAENGVAFTTYTNEKYQFSITFPKEWKENSYIVEHLEFAAEEPIMSVYHNSHAANRIALFDVYLFPEYIWDEGGYEENSLLQPLVKNAGYVFAYGQPSEHPYVNQEGTEAYNNYNQLIKQLPGITSSFLITKQELVKQEVEKMNEFIQKGIEQVYYVMNGGSGEIETFTKDGNDYRYLGVDLDTKEKVIAYLQQSFSKEAAISFLEQAAFIEVNGRLAQSNADGGSLLNWKNATASLLIEEENNRVYQYSVPYGDGFDQIILEVVFVKEKDGWKLNNNPFELT